MINTLRFNAHIQVERGREREKGTERVKEREPTIQLLLRQECMQSMMFTA